MKCSSFKAAFNRVASHTMGGLILAMTASVLAGHLLGPEAGMIAMPVGFLAGYLLSRRYGAAMCRKLFKSHKPAA